MGRRVIRRFDPESVPVHWVEPCPAEGSAAGVTITCLVNSTQPLYLTMAPDEREVHLEVEAVGHIQHKPLFNGRCEVECIFVTPNQCSQLRAGRLIIDGHHVVELGPLRRDNPVHCATLVDVVPKRFRLEVSVVDREAEHPSETLLVRHTLAILENDEYFGSISSSHLQNQVRDLPFYAEVIGKQRANWTEFIRAHTDKWDIFRYTADEIADRGLSSTCRSKECRLVAKVLATDYAEGDVARERSKVTAERELHDLLMEKLRVRPYEQSELLADLIKEKCFLATITPNLSKLLDYFEAFPDRYFVLRHHLHPIVVEAKRQGVIDDPKFDVWDNTPPKRYSFDFTDAEGGE